MKNVHKVILIIIVFLVVSTSAYTIKNQQNKIAELKSELQHEQLKYKMLYRDPKVRELIESGG